MEKEICEIKINKKYEINESILKMSHILFYDGLFPRFCTETTIIGHRKKYFRKESHVNKLSVQYTAVHCSTL